MESVDALIHKKDDRVRKEFDKWAIFTYSRNLIVINDKRPKARTTSNFNYLNYSNNSIGFTAPPAV